MNPLLFTDPVFLFCFAPVVLTLYFVLPRTWRNGYLLAASLLLYTWGEGRNAAVLLASIVINYACGLLIGRDEKSRLFLIIGITANLLLLAVFKYPAFIVANINAVITHMAYQPLTIPKVRLPVGMSFFTFMAISYLADVYQREIQPSKNPFTFATYLSMFPHLIAGPIVRFKDIAGQLHRRVISLPQITQGIRRFVIGLGRRSSSAIPSRYPPIPSSPCRSMNSPLRWRGWACCAIRSKSISIFQGIRTWRSD